MVDFPGKRDPTTTAPPCLSSLLLRLGTLLPSLSISSNPNRFKAQTPNRQFPNRFHNTQLKSLINFNFPITRRFSLMFLPVSSFGCWVFFLLASVQARVVYYWDWGCEAFGVFMYFLAFCTSLFWFVS
ncbi:hypothetical protein P8452_18016 [Trifolium repens]|nr:hypothetical protein P8452_18016 [Trifolium repens]